MQPLTRRHLLGAAGATALAAAPALAGASPALAALPTPRPTADDKGFLTFLATGSKVLRDLYLRAGGTAGMSAADRRALTALAEARRVAILKSTGPLGGDAPQPGDFDSVFAASDLADRASVLALAEKLERLLCGVEVNGAAYAADSATRLLIARLLSSDAEALAVVRGLAGKTGTTGLLGPVDVDAAGDVLDAYLSSPTAPQESR
ncbi:MAG TPA: hypothetical protein VHB30_14070 [Solirubrobacteraceae bacterium]|jgi:hypothetical protein|nr:hypothetical protein [Solirubrobacteraceae bacterium]